MSEASGKLLAQAFQARRKHRLDDARRDLVQAIEICRTGGGRADLAEALKGLGQIERDLGRNDAALRLYLEATGLCRAEGDALKLAHTVRHLGDIHQDMGHRELAELCYHEALAIYRGHPQTPPLELANAIRGLAILKFDTGQDLEAKSLWQEARDLYAAVNVETGVKESTRRLAMLDQKAGS